MGLDIVWSGFKRNLPTLLRLGALYLACELAIAAVLVGNVRPAVDGVGESGRPARRRTGAR
ncbi:MAG: hypothetical protein MZW92_64690 [Comamonadaceae bacterium]|nr:hypothetical protein [Comamonadaceae bacterium]